MLVVWRPLTFKSAFQRLHADAQESHKKERESIRQLKFFGFLVDQVRDGQTSLDEWAEASQRHEFGDYMDQPFVGRYHASISLTYIKCLVNLFRTGSMPFKRWRRNYTNSARRTPCKHSN